MTQNALQQQPSPGWFFGRWKKVFEKLDKPALLAEVKKLAEQFPNEDSRKLAQRVIKRSARHTAIIGAATSVPALVPGIGTAISIIGVIPEEIYLVRRQCEMVLKIAALFGFDPADNERLLEIIWLSGHTSLAVEAVNTAKYDIRRMAAKAAVHMSAPERGLLIGAKTGGRGILRKLPALGFFAGSAINYWTFSSMGKKAFAFYAKKHKANGEAPKQIGQGNNASG